MSIIRTRWAAIGAAIAVTLGAGGIGLVSATNPGDALTFIAVTPCRVLDTRVEFNVGPKASPMGPGEVHTVKTHGDNGNCENIPTTASAVSMNMTATDATAPTFLTVWATGTTRPEASSLNPVPGAPPTPNAVTTELNGAGEFNIYNLQGSVNVFADINGYYVAHDHDDRYYTKAQTDARVPASDSMTLAGGAFVSRDQPLAWKSGTSCFRPGTPASGMRHSIPITAGSTVTSLGVRASGGAASTPFIITLWAQRAGSTDGVTVHSEALTATGLAETTIDVPDELVDPGEALYVSFSSASTDAFLCALTVAFNRPG